MIAYYNEFDPKAAEWLRELICDGLIAPGEVDERSIVDVHPNDLADFEQCHFFAGIGGWSYALRLAQWPDNKPVWTASLPCQPFSAAGKGLGKKDERHLLPHFLKLVAKCKPDTIFGEQVEGAIKHGWLDDLQANMEAEGYAIGHCVLGAHSIGAAHIRQRLYWVADSQSERVGRASGISNSETRTFADSRGYENREPIQSIARSSINGMVYTNEPGSQQGIETAEAARYRCSVESAGGIDGMAYPEIVIRQHQAELEGRSDIERCGAIVGMGNAESERETRQSGQGARKQEPSGGSNISWLYCRDGKYRPIESGLKPLVDGIPRGMVHSSDPRNTQEARAMRLKGYGNAIVPKVASEFISAFMETTK